MPSLTFVVCCHNSALRLPTTLEHIADQDSSGDLKWDVLLVDNASTDNTQNVAIEIWARKGRRPEQLKVVSEPRLGIGYARYRGISESKGDLICFVDDDNWISRNFARIAVDMMTRQPNVAACGSLNSVVTDVALPSWFVEFQRSYAVGPQYGHAGDVTDGRGVLWSAGLVLRKEAVLDLFRAGFTPWVVGAQGHETLRRSEDYELCMALKLRGWKIWYNPELKLQHFIEKKRLKWKYLRRLLRGVGESDIGLLPFDYVQDPAVQPNGKFWIKLLRKELLQLLMKPGCFLRAQLSSMEGEKAALDVERSIGLIKAILRNRFAFDRRVLELRGKILK